MCRVHPQQLGVLGLELLHDESRWNICGHYYKRKKMYHRTSKPIAKSNVCARKCNQWFAVADNINRDNVKSHSAVLCTASARRNVVAVRLALGDAWSGRVFALCMM